LSRSDVCVVVPPRGNYMLGQLRIDQARPVWSDLLVVEGQ